MSEYTYDPCKNCNYDECADCVLNCEIADLTIENRQLKELLQTIINEEWLKGNSIEKVARKALSNT